MPLDKLVLILVVVIAAAGLTVWLGAIALAVFRMPGVWLTLIPAALVGYIVWRVIADRLTSSEDDHYDHIEK